MVKSITVVKDNKALCDITLEEIVSIVKNETEDSLQYWGLEELQIRVYKQLENQKGTFFMPLDLWSVDNQEEVARFIDTNTAVAFVVALKMYNKKVYNI